MKSEIAAQQAKVKQIETDTEATQKELAGLQEVGRETAAKKNLLMGAIKESQKEGEVTPFK